MKTNIKVLLKPKSVKRTSHSKNLTKLPIATADAEEIPTIQICDLGNLACMLDNNEEIP